MKGSFKYHLKCINAIFDPLPPLSQTWVRIFGLFAVILNSLFKLSFLKKTTKFYFLYHILVPSVCQCVCMSVCMSVCLYVVSTLLENQLTDFQNLNVKSSGLMQNRAHQPLIFKIYFRFGRKDKNSCLTKGQTKNLALLLSKN